MILLKVGLVTGQDSLNYFTPAETKIEAKVNEAFIIKLIACHSCGIHWNLDQADSSMVKLISVTYQNASGRKQQKGGDVYELWKFIGLHAGKYNLEFVLRGPAKEHKEYDRCKFELWVN